MVNTIGNHYLQGDMDEDTIYTDLDQGHHTATNAVYTQNPNTPNTNSEYLDSGSLNRFYPIPSECSQLNSQALSIISSNDGTLVQKNTSVLKSVKKAISKAKDYVLGDIDLEEKCYPEAGSDVPVVEDLGLKQKTLCLFVPDDRQQAHYDTNANVTRYYTEGLNTLNVEVLCESETRHKRLIKNGVDIRDMGLLPIRKGECLEVISMYMEPRFLVKNEHGECGLVKLSDLKDCESMLALK